jgi:hypothetical protein
LFDGAVATPVRPCEISTPAAAGREAPPVEQTFHV